MPTLPKFFQTHYPKHTFLFGLMSNAQDVYDPRSESHSNVIRKCLTDQCSNDLACDLVPQTKLHMFNLPQLIQGLSIADSGFNSLLAD